MKIKRTKRLPDSDIGSNFNMESDRYLNAAKEAVNKELESSDKEEVDEKDLVRIAKSAAGNKVLSHEIPVTVGKAIGATGIIYGLSKVPYKKAKNSIKNIGPTLKKAGKELIKAYKNYPKASIAVLTGIGTAAYNYPRIKKKYKDSRLAAEINTKSRIGKYRSNENIKN